MKNSRDFNKEESLPLTRVTDCGKSDCINWWETKCHLRWINIDEKGKCRWYAKNNILK